MKKAEEGFKKVDHMFKDQEEEFKSIMDEIDELRVKVGDMVSNQDAQRIWRHMLRFAEFEDLKDLYQRVIPEISRFEGKIIDFNQQTEKLNEIVRQFDENLMSKSDKMYIMQLQTENERRFASKDVMNDLITKINEISA